MGLTDVIMYGTNKWRVFSSLVTDVVVIN